MADTAKVQVFVRIRPQIAALGEESTVISAKKATEDTIVLTHPVDESANSGKQSTFTYNLAFDGDDTQEEFYESVKDLVDSTLDGHHATLFTYGQTGSGKTHTVLGKVATNENGKMCIAKETGLYMRVLNDLLRYKKSNRSHSHVLIALGILEIYNEQLRDLLNDRKVVDLKQNRFGDEAVPNLTLTEVSSLEECFAVYNIGNATRSCAPTASNPESSRSHAVFLIEMLQVPKSDCPDPPNVQEVYNADFVSVTTNLPNMKRSRLSLVDLAGCERVKKSEAEGLRMKEAQAINSSLTTLGKVVNALYEGKGFVNYRESKLTMLLKPSFDRQCAKVLLVTNISPIAGSYQESKGSLAFADRVMGLKAKSVFMIDAKEEADYIDSLHSMYSKAADLRIAQAQYDFRLHKPGYLRSLKGKNKEFSEKIIKSLSDEYKAFQIAKRKAEFDEIVFRLTHRRYLVEQRTGDETKTIELQSKIDEQEVISLELLNLFGTAMAKNDASDSCYKRVRKITKKLEENIKLYKEAMPEIIELMSNTRAEFVAKSNELNRACASLLRLDAPAAPVEAPPSAPVGGATVSVAARTGLPQHTGPVKSLQAIPARSPAPGLSQAQVPMGQGNATAPVAVDSTKSAALLADLAAMAANTQKIRSDREKLERDARKGSQKEVGEFIRELSQRKPKKRGSDEDEEDEAAPPPGTVMDDRLKKILLYSGLNKGQVKKALSGNT